MSSPRISILMPAYNTEKYIGEAIRSVLSQTFQDFELLIVNDGSVDNTQAVIESFSDDRIVLLQQTHGGVSKALNTGLSHAKGEYIARFDADDICLAGRLEKQYGFLSSNPAYVITGSDAEYILENGEHLFNFSCIAHTHEAIIQKLYFYCPFIHSGVMYRKDAVIAAGGYSLLAHNFEDYLLWTQLAKAGKLYNIPEILVKIRFNPASVTIDEKWRGRRFRELKRVAIRRGYVTLEEGEEIQSILLKQNLQQVKEGAYYALCAKKFLTDNFQPKKSRLFAINAIKSMPFRIDNYALLVAGYLPRWFIQWLHKRSPNKL